MPELRREDGDEAQLDPRALPDAELAIADEIPPVSHRGDVEQVCLAQRFVAKELIDIRGNLLREEAVERRTEHALGPPCHLAGQIAFAEQAQDVLVLQAAQ